MKKIIFSILIIFTFVFGASAQRHIKGIKAIDVMGGITGIGAYGELGYSHYLTKKFYIKPSVRYEMGKLNDSLKFSSTSINVAANYTIWNPGESFFLNVIGGPSLLFNSLDKKSYESVSYIIDKQNTVSYGIFAGLEAEVFLGDRVVWLANFRQQYNFKKDYGNWAWYLGTGLRFNIY